MHPLRKLREPGKPTAAQVSALLAENVVSTARSWYARSRGGTRSRRFSLNRALREVPAPTAEFKLDERTTLLRWEGTMDGHEPHHS
jgi:hypothetical protein